MSNVSTRRCTLPGCVVKIRANLLMCFPHWRTVPVELREEVWRTWRAQGGDGNRTMSPEYIAARDAAIESLTGAVPS